MLSRNLSSLLLFQDTSSCFLMSLFGICFLLSLNSWNTLGQAVLGTSWKKTTGQRCNYPEALPRHHRDPDLSHQKRCIVLWWRGWMRAVRGPHCLSMNTDPIRKVFAKEKCLPRVTDDHQKSFNSSEYQNRAESRGRRNRHEYSEKWCICPLICSWGRPILFIRALGKIMLINNNNKIT